MTSKTTYRVISWFDHAEAVAAQLAPGYEHARDFATLDEAMREVESAESEGYGPQTIRVL